MSGIIWLASYPKSGNTWFRIFLANLLRNSDQPVDINDLEVTRIANDRAVFDDETGIEASDFTLDEIDELRPLVYEQLAGKATKTLFMKAHDAWTFLPDGTPLLSSKATKGAIYFIRNPLDVAISYAHHRGIDIDNAITEMGSSDLKFSGKTDRLFRQLRQKILTWSDHVESWMQVPNVCVVRYEDMLVQPLESFSRLVTYAGLSYDRIKIEKALHLSDFRTLQIQEKEKGFNEKSPMNDHFFRSGRSGQWKEQLTAAQVDLIIRDHGDVMRRFGYL